MFYAIIATFVSFFVSQKSALRGPCLQLISRWSGKPESVHFLCHKIGRENTLSDARFGLEKATLSKTPKRRVVRFFEMSLLPDPDEKVQKR